MIKIFGKVRYHWQPELSVAITYWSLSFLPTFLALALVYERFRPSQLILLGFALTGVLTIFGLHRYFILEAAGIIRVVSFNPLVTKTIRIAEIGKLTISRYRLTFTLTDGTKKTFFMRKWPKKYFVDALVINPYFVGEVELVDNFIRLDYFWHYRKDKKPLVKD